MKADIYKRAKEGLAVAIDRFIPHRLNSYGVVFKGGDLWYADNDACYSDIWGQANFIREPVAFFSRTSKEFRQDYKVMDARPYVKWLIQDSPYADVFYRKGYVETCKTGIICNTDAPYDLFGAAIISHRTSYEYPALMKNWNILVNGGVSPEVAYMCMAMFSYSGDTLVAMVYENNHTPVYAKITVAGIRNFVKGEAVTDLVSFAEHGGYERTWDVWGKAGDAAYVDVHKRFKEASKEVVGRFGAPTYHGTEQDMIDSVLVLQQEVMEGL